MIPARPRVAAAGSGAACGLDCRGMSDSPERALLVFLDGVGIGDADPARNPFATARLPRLRDLLGGDLPVRGGFPYGAAELRSGVALVAADACLGVEGLPQSGTGQTALLTGENAPRTYGRHFGPWVPTGLRDMLRRESLLARARRAGMRVAFANAHPPVPERRPAAPPLAAGAVGALTRGAVELAAGDAVASSITNEHWRARLGQGIPEVSPEEAGRTLARIAAGAEVTLFAHYDTDIIGHRGDLSAAVAALERVDRFLGALLPALPAGTLLLIASDHGNVEDVSGGHTRNPVPVIASGPGSARVAASVRDLTHVTPTLLALLGAEP